MEIERLAEHLSFISNQPGVESVLGRKKGEYLPLQDVFNRPVFFSIETTSHIFCVCQDLTNLHPTTLSILRALANYDLFTGDKDMPKPWIVYKTNDKALQRKIEQVNSLIELAFHHLLDMLQLEPDDKSVQFGGYEQYHKTNRIDTNGSVDFTQCAPPRLGSFQLTDIDFRVGVLTSKVNRLPNPNIAILPSFKWVGEEKPWKFVVTIAQKEEEHQKAYSIPHPSAYFNDRQFICNKFKYIHIVCLVPRLAAVTGLFKIEALDNQVGNLIELIYTKRGDKPMTETQNVSEVIMLFGKLQEWIMKNGHRQELQSKTSETVYMTF